MAQRVSHVPLEALALPATRESRVSHVPLEALAAPSTVRVRVSHVPLEALANPATVRARAGHVIVEVLLGPAPPPPMPPIQPIRSRPISGKTPIKCANVWDWCLENDQRLWAAVEWALHGCIPPKCWRLEDNPLHAIPEQGREFHKYGMIPLPPVFGVDSQVLQFQVPPGYSGVVYAVLCKYAGVGYVNGSGDLLWRFRVNERWVKSLQAIPTELGDYSGYAQLDEFLRLSPGQTVRAYGWVNPATGLVGGSMIAALQGWYFPSQFAR